MKSQKTTFWLAVKNLLQSLETWRKQSPDFFWNSENQEKLSFLLFVLSRRRKPITTYAGWQCFKEVNVAEDQKVPSPTARTSPGI